MFSSIDHGGRYAYGNQPSIAHWNLARLAETLLPLMAAPDPADAVAQATEVVGAFGDHVRSGVAARHARQAWVAGAEAADVALAADWLRLLQEQRVDCTLAWRRLSDAAAGDANARSAVSRTAGPLVAWLARWRSRSARDSRLRGERAAGDATRVNPIYIRGNHHVEKALAAASDASDLAPFERLLDVLAQPFDERPGLEDYAEPAPAEVTAGYQTFCGTSGVGREATSVRRWPFEPVDDDESTGSLVGSNFRPSCS